MTLPYALEMRGIRKQFGSLVANDDVDFAAKTGEVHALLGENGAGKSTLMCMLSGVYRPTAGDILIRGRKVSIRSPKDALALGVGMVFQQFRLVPTLTAAENIILGEKSSVWRGASWMRRKTEEITAVAERFGLGITVDRPVWQMSVGEQQRVEIVKVLYRGADIILLDEPTSVLTPGEADRLFETLLKLRAAGKTVILTTHKLREVMAFADRISVMRKGRMLKTLNRLETNERELAQLMVGRNATGAVRPEAGTPGKPLLEVEGLTVEAGRGRTAVRGVSFTVREGEIVGIAGVAGNGQSELAEALAGLQAWSAGTIRVCGREWKRASVRTAIESGVSLVPENRMKSGLAGSLGIVDNLLMKTYREPERSRFGLLRGRRNREWARSLVERFDIRATGLDTPVRQLSGGNQQKLLLAREVDRDPKLMIAVHPTQGLDIGATESVHRLLLGLRASGRGVLLISEDLDEVMQLSDRILVMSGGSIVGEMSRENADRERIGLYMAGLRAVPGEAAS
ncbi:MAG: ABC transporter [Thermobacillus sp. ZCTH02-B1]|uniref:ABC transporter ATP-binding protein n=1 Tax=Thermobacillus sp. ZCTH02-B1 TaxID=1858795 RepID=UPI000B585E5F|nr:ABC transporter ATP-binding protein [Thermobacillus sp. ZCTH02-B1]OUM96592.1 MAG: ABC transporter [Thermobacillus sp. ZCTH02-B1]